MVEKTPKKDLSALKVGDVWPNGDILVEVAENRQLWKTTNGRFGVCKIVDNKFVVILKAAANEPLAKQVLQTGMVPPKPVATPKVAPPKATAKPEVTK